MRKIQREETEQNNGQDIPMSSSLLDVVVDLKKMAKDQLQLKQTKNTGENYRRER